jgi:hypothetical protein
MIGGELCYVREQLSVDGGLGCHRSHSRTAVPDVKCVARSLQVRASHSELSVRGLEDMCSCAEQAHVDSGWVSSLDYVTGVAVFIIRVWRR